MYLSLAQSRLSQFLDKAASYCCTTPPLCSCKFIHYVKLPHCLCLSSRETFVIVDTQVSWLVLHSQSGSFKSNTGTWFMSPKAQRKNSWGRTLSDDYTAVLPGLRLTAFDKVLCLLCCPVNRKITCIECCFHPHCQVLHNDIVEQYQKGGESIPSSSCGVRISFLAVHRPTPGLFCYACMNVWPGPPVHSTSYTIIY